MKLVFPTIEYKKKALEYIESLKKANSQIHGTGSLDRFLREGKSYEDWLIKLQNDIDIANLEEKLPALTYFYVDDEDNIVGMINCRFGLSSEQEIDFGHIGYSIKPDKREKGYGTKMLRDALKIYKKARYFEVYICALSSNRASIKVIKNNGGEFVRAYFDEKYGGRCECYKIRIFTGGKIIHTKREG